MKKTSFFISDLHFDHLRAAGENGFRKEFKTVDEMNSIIINNWNSVVKDGDKVFVLGDVALNTSEERLDGYLSQLKGTKVLVGGNHDNDPMKLKVFSKHFVAVVGCLEYKGMILTHIPVHPYNLKRFKINLHGHLHHSDILVSDRSDLYTYMELDPRYICVSCEKVGYTPKTLDQLMEMRPDAREICEKWTR